MNNLIRITSFGIIMFFIACGGEEIKNESSDKTATVLQENVVVADYKVEGMVCAMGCAKTIEDEVGDMVGVTVSTVDYESGKAHFEFDKTQTSEEAIKAKIATIADGQYKVTTWVEKSGAEEIEVEEESNSKVEVSLSNFEIPNLFTLLVKSL